MSLKLAVFMKIETDCCNHIEWVTGEGLDKTSEFCPFCETWHKLNDYWFEILEAKQLGVDDEGNVYTYGKIETNPLNQEEFYKKFYPEL